MIKISQKAIKGTITAPSSKSMMQRYVAIAALSDKPTVIYSPSYCDDSLACLNVAQSLGCKVVKDSNKVTIFPNSYPVNRVLNCNESGTSLRIFAAISATFSDEFELTGQGTLLTRPMDMIEDFLNSINVQCSSNNSFIPLKIKGPIKDKIISIDSSTTSQLLSGLLIACPTLKHPTQIVVSNLKSKPYIEMTLEALKTFAINIDCNDKLNNFQILPDQTPRCDQVTVEADWSGASFLLVAAAIAGSVTIDNINTNSKQADIRVLNCLEQFGAGIHQDKNSITINKINCNPFEFDATDCPDLFPPLVALAASAKGVSSIKGSSRLINKESNRALALITEYQKLGILIKNENDCLIIEGAVPNGNLVDSHFDHRIAMSLAVTALRSKEPVTIENSSVVSKSYPDFFEKLASLYE